MRKSAFIIGLVGIILASIVGFYGFYSLALIFAIAKANQFYMLCIYLIPISILVGIISIILTRKKPKIAGIIMFIAFVLNILPYVLVFTISSTSFWDVLKLFLIPSVPSLLFLVSAILSITTKTANL